MNNVLKKWATILNNREYREELSHEEEREMGKEGVVCIFGASDDLCELRGAFSDEIDCYGGGKFCYVSEADRFVENTYYERNPDELIQVDLDNRFYLEISSDKGYWTYGLPDEVEFEEFRVMEDEELYAIGKLILVKDLKKKFEK